MGEADGAGPRDDSARCLDGSYRRPMDQHEADERHARLLTNVAAARDLLECVGEDHWSRWMSTVHTELASGDAHGLTRLLGATGGMGSLNDLVIHPMNGHTVPEGELDHVNRSLVELVSSALADARALRRHLDAR